MLCLGLCGCFSRSTFLCSFHFLLFSGYKNDNGCFFHMACPGTGVGSKRKLPNLGLLFCCCCFCLLVFILWFEEAHLGILVDYFRLYTQELLLAAFQGPNGLLEIEPMSTACKSVITLWPNLCSLIKCLYICPLYLSL